MKFLDTMLACVPPEAQAFESRGKRKMVKALSMLMDFNGGYIHSFGAAHAVLELVEDILLPLRSSKM